MKVNIIGYRMKVYIINESDIETRFQFQFEDWKIVALLITMVPLGALSIYLVDGMSVVGIFTILSALSLSVIDSATKRLENKKIRIAKRELEAIKGLGISILGVSNSGKVIINGEPSTLVTDIVHRPHGEIVLDVGTGILNV